uniref:Glyco_18 domain-containing protein n=1 Tax=Caenorhabditis tropicalis TaxID=1561998 RepID=A0A1I7UCG0_9PELO
MFYDSSTNEVLLYRVIETNNEDPPANVSSINRTTVVLIVLLVCGILAFALSAFVLLSNRNAIVLPPTCDKRIIGYYTEFEPIHITESQLEKLTHVVFAYIKLNENGSLEFGDNKAKKRFQKLKNRMEGLKRVPKIMISIGGAEGSYNFANVIADSKKKSTFIDSLSTFFKNHKIDGVDMYWKWPTATDKYDYIAFLRELHSNFKQQYIISIVIPPAQVDTWEHGFDLVKLIDYVDFINVYTMDYNGPWNHQYGTPAGPSAPLYSGFGVRKNFNVDFTIQHYLDIIENPEKLNIVIPFYVRVWKNVKEPVKQGEEAFRNVELKNNGAEGSPYMSRWTAEHEGWKLTPDSWDEKSKSSFIYNQEKETYLTFETERSLNAKRNYVIEKQLGGVWIWSVEMDDNSFSLLNNITRDGFCFS